MHLIYDIIIVQYVVMTCCGGWMRSPMNTCDCDIICRFAATKTTPTTTNKTENKLIKWIRKTDWSEVWAELSARYERILQKNSRSDRRFLVNTIQLPFRLSPFLCFNDRVLHMFHSVSRVCDDGDEVELSFFSFFFVFIYDSFHLFQFFSFLAKCTSIQHAKLKLAEQHRWNRKIRSFPHTSAHTTYTHTHRQQMILWNRKCENGKCRDKIDSVVCAKSGRTKFHRIIFVHFLVVDRKFLHLCRHHRHIHTHTVSKA